MTKAAMPAPSMPATTVQTRSRRNQPPRRRCSFIVLSCTLPARLGGRKSLTVCAVDSRADFSVQLAMMAQAGARPDGDPANALRCTRCGTAVDGTHHTRTGYTVGHYVLHTGPTEETTIRHGIDDTTLTYRRLVRPVEVVSCPACFGDPATRRLWLAFGDEEDAA